MTHIKKLLKYDFDIKVSIRNFRYGAMFSTILLGLFGFIDLTLISDATALRYTLWIRFGLIIPIMISAIVFTYFERSYKKFHNFVSLLMAITVNCGVVSMLYISIVFNTADYYYLYFSALLLALSFSFLILWLSFVNSILLIASIVLTHLLLVDLFTGSFFPRNYFLNQLNLILIAGGLGLYVRISFSILNRQNLDKKLQLEKEKSLLEETNQHLSESIDVKHRVISVLSHDVRGPIKNIQAALELLLDKKISKEEFYYLIKVINQTLGATVNLVDDVLSWADASSLTFNDTRKIRVSEIVTEVFSLIRPVAESKNIILQSEVINDVLISNRQDIVRFVLRNLVGNSVKFTESGEINVKVRISKESILIIEVSDTGKGISDNLIDRIFSAHKNISERGTKNEKGNGLGLYLCKQILNENNGDISFTTKKGIGTSFIFQLAVDTIEFNKQKYSCSEMA